MSLFVSQPLAQFVPLPLFLRRFATKANTLRPAYRYAAIVFLAFPLSTLQCLAAGCESQALQFEEKFADVRNWPDLGDASHHSIQNGHLVVSVADGKWDGSLYRGDVFDDGDICVSFDLSQTTHKSGEQENALACVVFWAKNWSNYYRFCETPEGSSFNVDRIVAGRSLGTSWTKSPTLKTGANINTMRVSIRGGQAKYFINDQEIQPPTPVAAHPPDGGGLIGFLVASMAGTQYDWEISSFKVSK